jgi:hypothetical protein
VSASRKCRVSPADRVRFWLQYNYPRYPKLYPLVFIGDGKRRLDWLRGHLYELWKNTPDASSSSRYAANKGNVINQLIGVKKFREANGNWPAQPMSFPIPRYPATKP